MEIGASIYLWWLYGGTDKPLLFQKQKSNLGHNCLEVYIHIPIHWLRVDIHPYPFDPFDIKIYIKDRMEEHIKQQQK